MSAIAFNLFRRGKIPALALLLFFGLAESLTAQKYIARVEHYSVEQGLSHRQVNTIYQDHRGFVWIGTPNGLNRFDGYGFRQFTKENAGLPFNYIQDITEDADGWLWLVEQAEKSICLFHPDRGEVLTLKEKFGNSPLANEVFHYKILSDQDGGVWLSSTLKPVLYRYHPASGVQAFPMEYPEIRPVYWSKNNTLWVTIGADGLSEVSRNGKIVRRLENFNCWSITDYGIWGNKKKRTGFAQFVFYNLEGIPQPDRLPNLKEKKHPYPALIFPFDDQGAYVVHDRLIDAQGREVAKWTFEKHDRNNFLWRSFFKDKAGRYWLGDDFGFYMLEIRPNRFQHYFYNPNAKPGLGNSTRGILATRDKIFANLERSGLFEYDRQNGQTRHVLATDSIWSHYALAFSSKGEIFSGNVNAFYRLNPDAGSSTRIPTNFDPWAFCEDKTGRLWIGSATNGLHTLAPGASVTEPFTRYNGLDALSKAFVLHIEQDASGMLWVCGNNGFYKVDPQKGVVARYWSGGAGQHYLPAENFMHFHLDADGVFWFATATGLLRVAARNEPDGSRSPVWDPKSGKLFNRNNCLSNDVVYAVYEDKQGKLWMPTDFGINCLDKKTETTRAYFLSDGITDVEFNRAAHFQGPDGRLYFGGLNGVNAFYPADFTRSDNTPVDIPLALTLFQQFDTESNRNVDNTVHLLRNGTIELKPGDRFNTLEVALLGYENPSLVQYAWKVENLDPDWHYQRERQINIGGLPYGTHQLRIKARAADGRWSNRELRFTIRVLRPWYLQSWFLALFALLSGVAVRGYIRWRNRRHILEQKKLELLVHKATEHIEKAKETIEIQAEELRRLDKVKSNFFANVSHELRTPLTIILGMTEQVKAEIQKLESAKTKPAFGSKAMSDFQNVLSKLNLVRRNGENLLHLINQILDLAKLESEPLKFNYVQGDVLAYLRYIAESLHSVANAQNILLRVESSSNAPGGIVLDFDPERLRQIVYNLLSNAIKFTPSGGRVTLNVSTADAQPETADAPAECLFIKITDTGVGIPPADLPHIFERFYQAANQEKSAAGGTGIGLSLTKELVQLMGGAISVESAVGKGTTFSVRLPVSRQAPLLESAGYAETDRRTAGHDAPVLPRPDAAPDASSPALLLIEDNPDVVEYLAECLKPEYALDFAYNGRAGIEKALDTTPDLIVSDVMMPEKDGFAVVETLKNDARTSHIPIILLTAKADMENRIAGLRRGADAYLAKPFNKEVLTLTVRNLLELQKKLAERYRAAAVAPLANTGADQQAHDPENEFLQKLRNAVEARIGDANLSVDDVCRAVGMGRSNLYAKLAALTSLSFNIYVRTLRLNKAKELLASGEMNVSEVAYALGFNDPKYFSRVFSEEFGAPPSEWLKS